MKKIVTLLLTLCALLCIGITLVSCDNGENPKGECTHQWGEWSVTKSATCTEAGIQEHTCSECGEKEISTLNALGHDWNEATCSTPKTCKTCSATEGSASAHAYTVETVKDEALKSAATCTSAEVYYKSCSCGAISINDADTFTSGAALDHKDENTDHICDNNCGKNDMGVCSDSNTDNDHVCDYGCEKTLNDCSDVENDNNHDCDTCNKADVSAHNYSSVTYETPAMCFECGRFKASEGLVYTLMQSGDSYSVSQGSCTDAYVYIPSTYNGLPVTNIANRAFVANRNLISIIIPDSVTVIEDEAFSYCASLKSIVIPNGVTSISKGAFSYCESLTNIAIPESITSIGEMAFWGCKALTGIVIPNGVTSIKSHTFNGCSSLTSITIPDGIINIGDGAFYYCISLTSIAIPSGVESIGAGAFRDCHSLTSITIPEGVSSIGEYAFVGNVALTTYCEAQSKPDGWNAKWNALAEYLSNEVCPVVWNCKNNDLADDGYIYIVMNGIRYGIKDGIATVVRQPTTIKQGEILSTITYNDANYDVTSISTVAFKDCADLTDLEIPNTITSISPSLFGDCDSLKYTEYGNALYLGNKDNMYLALIKAKSTDILSCEIHTSTKMIADKAFFNCSSLTRIVIPKSVKIIGNGAIHSSPIVYCESESQPSGWHTSWQSNNIVVWGYTYVFADGIMYGIKDEEATVVRQHSTLQEAKILSSVLFNGVSYPVTKIGDLAFFKCVGLTSIEIPYGVTNIGNSAFSACASLSNIELADSVVSIGETAFNECTSLTKIIIPKSVLSIGLMAFNRATQNLTVYCEAASKPNGWHSGWSGSTLGTSLHVEWGYVKE